MQPLPFFTSNGGIVDTNYYNGERVYEVDTSVCPVYIDFDDTQFRNVPSHLLMTDDERDQALQEADEAFSEWQRS